ncbi:mechanosensitive ion channel family protein (plasmid) [Paracoccus yeei]|uniref:mechanosensitive ion channel family protein n=1 Tax=Paracoccus yeei TaxID=147645 RepID=UPI003BF7BE2F
MGGGPDCTGWNAARAVGLAPVLLLALAVAPRAELPPELADPSIDRARLAIRVVPLSEPELAGRWFGIVQGAATAAAAFQVDVVAGDDKALARHDLNRQVALRNKLMRNFMEVVRAWEQKGGDAGTVAKYRAYRNAVLIGGTRFTDLRTTGSRILLWLASPDGGGRLAVKAGIILLQLAVVVLIATACGGVLRHMLSRVTRNFLVVALRSAILVGGTLIVLSLAGLDVAPIYALLGGSSIIAALAFQESLSNIAAGMMIMLVRPFDEGDQVEISGTRGRAKSVGIVATVVMTPDNRTVLIPNRKVWGGAIVNISAAPVRRLDLDFCFPSGEAGEKVRAAATDCLSRNPKVLDQPVATVRLVAAQGGVGLQVRPWIRTQDFAELEAQLQEQLVAAFTAVGLSPPASIPDE